LGESDVCLHSAAVDPNFSSAIHDTFCAFFLLHATFEMFCNWLFCLTVLREMYSAICDSFTQLDTRWQEQFGNVLD
jgi:hypothetical protein